ncbi:E3 ubiquitin-protein ligase ATL59-like [Papaver somniferum]|uniref:E3 ubiquitin-protein ligase ATL59-like n=1 Tax=Papaver somniferum TaxID=3469 RepID=UPI000E70292D|nr:E3 ubiquitin-protein ligase ATL59-like [Papaver somniferum]
MDDIDDHRGLFFLCLLAFCFLGILSRFINLIISGKWYDDDDSQTNEARSGTTTQQQEQQHMTENTTASAQSEILNIISSMLNGNTSMGIDFSSQPRNDPSTATECTLNLVEIGTSLPSECTICLEDFHADNQHGGDHKICMLHECKHMFHADCIKMWVNSKQGISTHTCPNCRVSL